MKVVDLRHNFLVSLPVSLAYHPTLEALRLAYNLFLEIPPLLNTLPMIKEHGLNLAVSFRKNTTKDLTEVLVLVGYSF